MHHIHHEPYNMTLLVLFNDVSRGGVTLQMTGYAPLYTKHRKGSFFGHKTSSTSFAKKGIFFPAIRTSGVPE